MKHLTHKIIAAKAVMLIAMNSFAIPMCQEVLSLQDTKTMENIKTSHGVSLNDIQRSGAENPDSSIGCYAGDEESYTSFAPLFNKVITKYHGHDVSTKQVRNFDISGINFSGLDSDYIISTRVRVARNLKDHSFPSTINKKERKEVEKLLRKHGCLSAK